MRNSSGNDDGGNFANHDNQQQQSSSSSSSNQGNLQHQKQEGEEAMVSAITVDDVDNQIVDMTDWDFSKPETINRAIEIVSKRQGRAIMLSTATGITRFNRSQCSAVDSHRLMQAPMSHVNRAIKCACEQNRRGLYFVLGSISGKEDEREEAMRRISNQGGTFESNEYSIVYREGEFG